MKSQGWRLFVHPLFEAQLEKLTTRVEKLAAKNPRGYLSDPAAKMLATIHHYVREVIPRDPNSPEFRQGNTLGPGNRHWFRAKFHRRYRLFFRFSTQEKVIIYVWINDEGTLRKAGSKTDPYAVFKAMIEKGEPPNSFAELLQAAKEI
ncbi:MAG: type II toxin-antitoxin system YhaV family toxin [Acidobacteriaceae bacterium]|nr:type II toxin-antitoxin system YhaV family toxin [Acidobacteriaceae bacterium]MBV9294418.1 type II toxin-antitoxin system YhaV family toxin [Acidobacteriaceae bacterium]MBV9767223.1 type II toxin-antitoxin system YhaV family toxin [Acidobacteriaceae bacterium]